MTTDVFLIIGQSNAVGRAPFDNGAVHPVGTLQFSNKTATQDTVIAATVPLEHGNSRAGEMGLDVSFAEDYAALNTGDTLLFMPNAVGATGLGDSVGRWAVGNADLYTETVTRANALLALDPSYVLRGIIIQLGERDTVQNTAAATFRTLFDELITELRANITGAANVRVSVGPLLPSFVANEPNGPAIEAELIDTPNRLSNVQYIPSTGLNLVGFDSVHFDAASLRTLGSQHLDNFQDLLGAAPPVQSDPWFDLTVGNQVVGGPHADFPLRVTEQWLTASQRDELFATARSDGANVRFSSDNSGDTQYPFEFVAWDAVAKTFIADVKLPSLAIGTEFTLRIVSGAVALPTVTDPNGRNATWTGAVRKWPLRNSLADSSGNASENLSQGETYGPNGLIADGASGLDMVDPAQQAAGSAGAWITPSGTASPDNQLYISASSPSRLFLGTSGTELLYRLGHTGPGAGNRTGGTAADGVTTYVELTWDAANNAALYQDGQLVEAWVFPQNVLGNALWFNSFAGSSAFAQGAMRDASIWATTKSADWIETEYANQTGAAFGSSSDMQTGGGASIDISPLDEIVTVKLETAPALSMTALRPLVLDDVTVGVTGAPQLGGPSTPSQRTYLPQRSTRTLLPRP